MARTDPLSLLDVDIPALDAGDAAISHVRPLALRCMCIAPSREVPVHRFDPETQIAVGQDGLPVLPQLAKDWSIVEGTHTDGDGGDNEMWGWEER